MSASPGWIASVSGAVFQGRQMDDPAPALAAHQLAAEVLGGKLGGLRLTRVMGGEIYLFGWRPTFSSAQYACISSQPATG
jgi:hypothetical protein